MVKITGISTLDYIILTLKGWSTSLEKVFNITWSGGQDDMEYTIIHEFKEHINADEFILAGMKLRDLEIKGLMSLKKKPPTLK